MQETGKQSIVCKQKEKSMQEGIKLAKRQENKLCQQKEIKIMQEDGLKRM
jgi:hypothetical protein